MIDVRQLLEHAPGFVGLLRVQVLDSGPDGGQLRMDAGPELHNHVGGPHAAVIFGLGETAAFAVLLEVFGDLVEDGCVPLVKQAQVAYSAVATGPLLAAAHLLGRAGEQGAPEQGVRDSLAHRGRASFDVEVVFSREGDGVETARASYRMALLRPS